MSIFVKKIMSNGKYQLLNVVKTLDEVNAIVQQHQVSKYRTSNLSNSTKYSYRCSQYRKYPLCRYEIQVYITDDNSTNFTIMFKHAHCHEQHNHTSRLLSYLFSSIVIFL